METDRNQPSELRTLNKNNTKVEDIEEANNFTISLTKNTILKNAIHKEINWFLFFILKTIIFFIIYLIYIILQKKILILLIIISITYSFLDVLFYKINKSFLKKNEKRLFFLTLIIKTSIYFEIIFFFLKKTPIHAISITLIIHFLLKIYSNCFITEDV